MLCFHLGILWAHSLVRNLETLQVLTNISVASKPLLSLAAPCQLCQSVPDYVVVLALYINAQ